MSVIFAGKYRFSQLNKSRFSVLSTEVPPVPAPT
jgi:hypothetical protein